MNNDKLLFEDLELTAWWWGTLKSLSTPLKIQILNECLPLCKNEACLSYLRGVKTVVEMENISQPLSARFIADFHTLWRMRPYFVISAFAAIGYMMVKGGITIGRLLS